VTSSTLTYAKYAWSSAVVVQGRACHGQIASNIQCGQRVSTPEERLAAAVRLIEHHQALRGGFSKIPRSAWPGEVVIAGEELG
jgi:hypothetical protein